MALVWVTDPQRFSRYQFPDAFHLPMILDFEAFAHMPDTDVPYKVPDVRYGLFALALFPPGPLETLHGSANLTTADEVWIQTMHGDQYLFDLRTGEWSDPDSRTGQSLGLTNPRGDYVSLELGTDGQSYYVLNIQEAPEPAAFLAVPTGLVVIAMVRRRWCKTKIDRTVTDRS